MNRRPGAVAGAGCLAAAALLVLSACSSGGTQKSASVSTLALRPGMCLNPPAQVKQELASVTTLPCAQPHTEEVYSLARYDRGPTGATADYPGSAPLDTFAKGACAQDFQGYVGIAYPDSQYFFTYLLPSPRGWQKGGDRDVVCLVTTTGQQIKGSVKGTKK